MKSKKLLFGGILILLIGILLKRVTDLSSLGLILIILGVSLKTIYIISKARSGEYKPGTELFVLAIGLLIFFTGLSLKSIDSPIINPAYLMIIGIGLKVTFIIMFVRNVRSNTRVA